MSRILPRPAGATAATSMSPESEDLAPEISANVYRSLNGYIEFLALLANGNDSTIDKNLKADSPEEPVPAVFDYRVPSSPLPYDASRTALVLLDVQGFVLSSCNSPGLAALAKAKAMREWAFANHITVIHSIIDFKKEPRVNRKASLRNKNHQAAVKTDNDATEEQAEGAFSRREGEHIVVKDLAYFSSLKSTGLMALLRERIFTSLILCGLPPSGVVLRTAATATNEGFVVSIIQDACSDPSDVLHGTLMSDALPSTAHVANAEEFMEAWAKCSRRRDKRQHGRECM